MAPCRPAMHVVVGRLLQLTPYRTRPAHTPAPMLDGSRDPCTMKPYLDKVADEIKHRGGHWSSDTPCSCDCTCGTCNSFVTYKRPFVLDGRAPQLNQPTSTQPVTTTNTTTHHDLLHTQHRRIVPRQEDYGGLLGRRPRPPSRRLRHVTLAASCRAAEEVRPTCAGLVLHR